MRRHARVGGALARHPPPSASLWLTRVRQQAYHRAMAERNRNARIQEVWPTVCALLSLLLARLLARPRDSPLPPTLFLCTISEMVEQGDAFPRAPSTIAVTPGCGWDRAFAEGCLQNG